jgi:hypothetical protein
LVTTIEPPEVVAVVMAEQLLAAADRYGLEKNQRRRRSCAVSIFNLRHRLLASLIITC